MHTLSPHAALPFFSPLRRGSVQRPWDGRAGGGGRAAANRGGPALLAAEGHGAGDRADRRLDLRRRLIAYPALEGANGSFSTNPPPAGDDRRRHRRWPALSVRALGAGAV